MEKYERRKIVSIFTLGCKTNQYETDALMDIFFNNRYDIVDFDDFADIYIINTCTVTNVGDKKSRQMIRRAKKNNPNSIVVVMGCYAQISTEEVAAISEVDIVIGTEARGNILKYIEDFEAGKTPKPYVIVNDIMKINTFEELKVKSIKEHTRAFIKIQEGCNQFCSYCIIPYARGLVRSREAINVCDEIRGLVKQNYKEFVLTGIHIGSYGIDFDGYKLIDLLVDIHQIEGVERIRLGSIEPRLIDADFIEKLKPLYKVCDHFHLSLQSGSDTVLKRMNRKYTAAEYEKAVISLREIYENPAITTDIIVGFPGESDDEFAETMEFVKKINFSEIHVFKFSKRKGTPAATMENQIDESIKKTRSELLMRLASDLSHDYREKFLDTEMEVLVEEFDGEYWIGHTKNYLKVKFKDGGEVKAVKNVRLTELSESEIYGI